MEQVAAGRDAMGGFAPKFAQLNDDVPFGEVWSREEQLPSSLPHHIQRAKANGVTGEEMAEALTQLAFYAGWPKAWTALRMAKEVYSEQK